MAELPSVSITTKHARNAVGHSNNVVSELCRNANVNKWSFYRPRPIQANNTTKLVEFATVYASSKLGDFRRYDHSAAAPYVVSSSTKNYIEGSATVDVEVDVRTERMNVIEIVGLTTPYLQTDFYSSTSDRTARTNRKGFERVLFDLGVEAPPVGHSNNQTQAPLEGAQVIMDEAQVSWLSATPNGYLYCETFVCDSSGNALIRFDDNGYTTIAVNKLYNPKLSVEAQFTYPALGYDAVALIRMDGIGLTDADADQVMTVNTGNASFYFALVGFVESTNQAFRLGASSFSGRLRIGSTNYDLGVSSLAWGSNQSISTSNLFGTDDAWQYNDIAYLEFISASGITEGDELDITNTPW